MKAIQINEHGSIEVLKLSEINEPECTDSKVKIEIKACAINHLDIWVRKGFENLILPLPLILGSDASGTIVEKGKDVEDYNIGDDVVVQPAQSLDCSALLVVYPDSPTLYPAGFFVNLESVAQYGRSAQLIHHRAREL